MVATEEMVEMVEAIHHRHRHHHPAAVDDSLVTTF